MSLRVTLHFSPSAWVPAWDHKVDGEAGWVVAELERLLATRRTCLPAFLTWGKASFTIEACETLAHALQVCRRDLADPGTCFDDPDEEADCRRLVDLLSAAPSATGN